MQSCNFAERIRFSWLSLGWWWCWWQSDDDDDDNDDDDDDDGDKRMITIFVAHDNWKSEQTMQTFSGCFDPEAALKTPVAWLLRISQPLRPNPDIFFLAVEI